MPHRKRQNPATEEQDLDHEESTLNEEPSESVPNELVARIEALEKELEQAQGERLRALADFQNFRRRKEQEERTLRQFATEDLITSLLPILDNFERTVHHLEDGADPAKMLEGIKAVERQLRSVLERQNLKRINSIGLPFDPEVHEAVATQVSEEHDDDTVVAELEPGYRIADRVIRPARVKVARRA